MSINQQSKVWINKPPWPTPSLIWISMFMSMLMSIFIYRRPPCLMYMFLMYKLTDKAHERIKEKVYVNPTWANQNQNPGVIQTDELKWLVAQLHSDRGGNLPNMLFCIFLHPHSSFDSSSSSSLGWGCSSLVFFWAWQASPSVSGRSPLCYNLEISKNTVH